MKFINKKTIILTVVLGIVIIAVVAGFLAVKASYSSDSFTDETSIGKGTAVVNIDTSAGQVKLQECYSPDPSWSKITDTTVRNIAGAYNETVEKDIYCDDSNCLLWTDGVEIYNTVCIATDANVYANILWSASDYQRTWGPTTSAISGGDIGGTHGSISVGNNNVGVSGKTWLERYYTSAIGTYPAMDACKAKGSGWRLPTILELDSIRDQAKGSAPYSRLPFIVSSNYWSSSEYSTSRAYYLSFYSGNVGYNLAKSDTYYVRCVRGQ